MTSATSHTDTKPFVTVTEGMRGWFAVEMWWNPDMGGFWEPWQTSPASFGTPEEAEQDAKSWAEADNIRFVPHKTDDLQGGGK